MNVLAFDTSFQACSVAVSFSRPGEEGGLHCEHALMDTGHAEALIPMIDRVMRAAGATFAALDRIIVTTGPGSFTGVRTAVAAGRALALATPAKVMGVSSLWAIGVGAVKRLPDGRAPGDAVLVAMDARKGMVYAQVIGADASELTAPLLLDPAEAVTLAPTYRLSAVGTSAAQVCVAGKSAERPIAWLFDDVLLPDHHLPHAIHLMAAVHRQSGAGALQPFYLRPPDAKPQAGKSLPWSST